MGTQVFVLNAPKSASEHHLSMAHAIIVTLGGEPPFAARQPQRRPEATAVIHAHWPTSARSRRKPACPSHQRTCRRLEGGRIEMPFEPAIWAKRIGKLVDRYDVAWLINCEVTW
jgi:hypothetical protein